jgi:hypothetical protein
VTTTTNDEKCRFNIAEAQLELSYTGTNLTTNYIDSARKSTRHGESVVRIMYV